MQRFFSPLRYPGGKSKISNFFAEIIKINKLNNCIYVEPYAGGAGSALNLLFKEYVDKIIINDADYNIYCFWHSVLFDTDSFIKLINKTEISMNNWRKQKLILSKNKNYSALKIGFATFFLNRCNMSGIITGGPIGGYKQLGKWKIDARFNKSDLIERINRIAFYRNRIKLFNLDALDLIDHINNSFPSSEKSSLLFFLDPPYYVKGEGLYLNYYKPEDHEKLSEYLHKFRKRWILTYDNVPEIVSLYRNKRQFNYKINYSANKFKKGNEVIIFSDDIRLPHIYLKQVRETGLDPGKVKL